MDHAKVADHYNARPKETRDSRQLSPIYRMRQFNNWLKFVLIDLHTQPGNSALDLCCGKGGDLFKWMQASCRSYVGCDIASVAVGLAVERFNQQKMAPFRPTFCVGDCFAVRLVDFLGEDVAFDVVSCQFSMHYAFESEARVRQLLQNVSEQLRPGGFFIGTTIDSNVLIRKIRAVNDLEVSSSIYRVRFDERHGSKRFSGTESPFGIRYTFTLDQSVEDCPEFLVHFPSFVKMAAEFDLEPVMHCNFHDFFTEFSNREKYANYHRLLFTMNVVDDQGTISPDEWDAIYLYTAFAFRKSGQRETPPQKQGDESVGRKQWPPIESDEIIVME